eukprot:scaffold48_cov311-Pinguiococcus_pyrenoidosus.AAC.140
MCPTTAPPSGYRYVTKLPEGAAPSKAESLTERPVDHVPYVHEPSTLLLHVDLRSLHGRGGKH